MLTPQIRSQLIRERMETRYPGQTDFSHDDPIPGSPMGHAAGYRIASDIVRHYRRTHRPESMFITPDELIETIVAAGVDRWVLMGLYGYVGYLPQPRATQDVDVLIDNEQIDAALAAVLKRWPRLVPDSGPIVIRLRDPGEIGVDGEVKVVIDLMRPTDSLYEAILSQHHITDSDTGHRLPIIEAALAAKYSAIVSPYRLFERKLQDAVDFRSIAKGNRTRIDHDIAHQLAELIYPGGGQEILEFINLAQTDQPFPV
ncbi:hypothetical protein [Rubripirellula reticaptiva]|nr:hypothetical protein [Rubripirellula reticaptiva]